MNDLKQVMLWVEHREPLNDGMAQKQYSNHSKHRNPKCSTKFIFNSPCGADKEDIQKMTLLTISMQNADSHISVWDQPFSYKHLFYQNRICIKPLQLKTTLERYTSKPIVNP